MRRRGDRDESDSTELMLDAICNVFGGIILMAILVVVQTQTTAGMVSRAERQTPYLEVEYRKLEFEIGRRRKELAELSGEKERLEKVAGEVDATAVAAGLDAQIARKTADNTQLEAEQQKLKDACDKAAKVPEPAAPRGPDLAAQVAQKQDRVGRLKTELAERKKPRSTKRGETRLKDAPADAEARFYVVKDARAYRLGEFEPAKGHTGKPYRSHDCSVVMPNPGVGMIEVRPVTTAGVDVPTDGSAPAAFMKTLDGCTPRGHFVLFMVYCDSASFATFNVLRDAIDDPARRFAYNVVPLRPRAGALQLPLGSGGDAKVLNR
ncbi:MAG TPA: hypothetical protein VMY39_07920 [Planctomycetota bacterium]|nr:hypothetical protein [Planctomycetota bacterium]